MKSYKDLEIYQQAFKFAMDCHKISLALPKYELYETGSQLRRASQSVRANIVEGYGRKDYKKEFLRFLIFAHASNLEAKDHLEMLNELYQLDGITEIIEDADKLGKQIYSFIMYVDKNWKTKR